jgi:acid phosphatase (class A)
VARAIRHALLALGLAGCAALDTKPEPVPEIRPGLLQGYLSREELPNSLALLPPPPEKGSVAFALDEEVARKSIALRGTPRWALATADADLGFPNAAAVFACALNAPITEERTPHLYQLLRRTLTDAALSTYAAKDHYHRTRPFAVNEQPLCTPDQRAYLESNGSYPSGHTAIGWAWALILAELSPEQTDAILARGAAYGDSRNVCNVHWYSDVVQGRMMGAATVARLHADPVFRADLDAAQAELEDVRADGLTSTRDCAAEAAALAK